MGFFSNALAQLHNIVDNGAGDHSDMLHEAIQYAETNPQQLGQLIGRLSNHPEIGDQVQQWMGNPQAQAFLSRIGGAPGVGTATADDQTENGRAYNDRANDDDDYADDNNDPNNN